ncbi:MAG: hypothetical protein U1F14_02720 [Steroidobacteraceae bacterium]
MNARILPFPDATAGAGDNPALILPKPDWRSFVTATGLPGPTTETGIEVSEYSEQELCRITAQRVYMVRCECGRRWFELDLPAIAECPACRRLGSLAG